MLRFPGYIAAFSETLSMAVLEADGANVLKQALINEPEDHIKVGTSRLPWLIVRP